MMLFRPRVGGDPGSTFCHPRAGGENGLPRSLRSLAMTWLQEIMHLQHLQLQFITALFENPEQSIGFNIYRNNILNTKIKALKNTFPIIHALIGDDCFRAVAKDYFYQHWQHAKSLTFWGQYFHFFLKHFAPLQSLPYLPDVAALEWATYLAMNGTKTPTLLNTQFPIFKIWQMHQPNYEGEEHIELTNEENWLVVYQCGWEIVIEQIGKEDYEFLQLVQSGSLEVACETWNGAGKEILSVLTKAFSKGWVHINE